MRVVVDGYAWVSKADLTAQHMSTLREHLTVYPKRIGEELPPAIRLFRENEQWFGVPRAYYLPKRKPSHDVEFRVSDGDKTYWPGDLKFTSEKTLRAEQRQGLDTVLAKFRAGELGGIFRAPPGFGKTVVAAALIAELNVPTLVTVHTEFLRDQWKARLEEYLPGVRVGFAQAGVLDFRGKHVVIGMMQSLSDWDLPEEFRSRFGLLLVDECHRISAATFSKIPGKFTAKYRLGTTATPRRKDGAECVFFYHLGPELFAAKEESLAFKVRFVMSDFYLVKSRGYNGLAGRSVILSYLCGNEARNRFIVQQLILALEAGRTILLVSERLDHLRAVNDTFREMWPVDKPVPSVGYYIGGTDSAERARVAKCRLLLATSQLTSEGLDIPALDTLFLTTPLTDVEQVVGRIRRPYSGKKSPVVVDFRDDRVPAFRRAADERMRYYKKMQAVIAA